MIFGLLKSFRLSHQTLRALQISSSIFVSDSCLLDLNVMKEIRVGRPSLFSTTVTDVETRDQPSSEDASSSTSAQLTPEIEKRYVHRVYDAIAPHFSSTRFAKWPKVALFLDNLPSGSLVLDAGCGNGKYDISFPLVSICADKGHEALVADAVNLPYKSGFRDAAISIALLHHLSTISRRRKAIEELVRVVKKGGLVLITVWAVEQEDQGLLNKWIPLSHKYLDEWIGPDSPRVRSPHSFNMESIPESEENGSQESCNLSNEPLDAMGKEQLITHIVDRCKENHQEYFVPWHLPYHRAEVSGASACAVASGLARKDDRRVLWCIIDIEFSEIFKKSV